MDWEPRIGMKVVCVNDTWTQGFKQYPGLIKVGFVYTIRWVGVDHRTILGPGQPVGAPDIWLDGVFRTEEDLGLGAFRFKPLRERKTSISIFTAMLDHTPKELIPASYEVPGIPFQ